MNGSRGVVEAFVDDDDVAVVPLVRFSPSLVRPVSHVTWDVRRPPTVTEAATLQRIAEDEDEEDDDDDDDEPPPMKRRLVIERLSRYEERAQRRQLGARILEGLVIARRKQVPLRLAWALSVRRRLCRERRWSHCR